MGWWAIDEIELVVELDVLERLRRDEPDRHLGNRQGRGDTEGHGDQLDYPPSHRWPHPRRRRKGSVRVAVANAVPERLDEYQQVEGETPALDVVEIALDSPFDRGVPAPAVDLGPSGDARLHLVAKHVPRHAAPEFLDEARPLRSGADQAHLAAQHVEELR